MSKHSLYTNVCVSRVVSGTVSHLLFRFKTKSKSSDLTETLVVVLLKRKSPVNQVNSSIPSRKLGGISYPLDVTLH